MIRPSIRWRASASSTLSSRILGAAAFVALGLTLPLTSTPGVAGETAHGADHGHDTGHGHDKDSHGDASQGHAADGHGGHDMTMTPGNKRFVHGGFPDNDRADGETIRKRAAYTTPAVTLRTRQGEAVRLGEVLNGDRPVVMQFVFTTCATICPVLSASMAQAKDGLLEAAPETRLVSITIDPEYDTPARLREYAAKHDAGESWTFLTGRRADVDRTIRAFDALFEANNKMYHEPYTYMRAGGSSEWLRLNGLMSAGEMVAAYRGVLAGGDQKASAQ